MIKRAMLSAVILSMVFLPIVSYAGFHDPELEKQTVEGQIYGVDTSSYDITVKKVSFHDQITIHVPYNTNIYKQGKAISLDDIHEGDNVVVDFYNDSPGPLKATKITVTS